MYRAKESKFMGYAMVAITVGSCYTLKVTLMVD